jgi:hypothetical protein
MARGRFANSAAHLSFGRLAGLGTSGLERLSLCRRGRKQRPTTAKRCSSGTGRPVFFDFRQINNLQALREVTRLIKEKRNQSLRSRLKIRRKNGENIILRDIFEKIITYVQKFKEIGDVAV